MTRRWQAVALVCGLWAALLAPPARAACVPPVAPLDEAAVQQGLREARDRGFLWRIEKDGRSSWLFGTLHVAERGWMFPGPQLQQALRAADHVALEMDLTDPEVQRRMREGISAGPGTPALSAPLAQRLAVQARARCAEAALAGLKPEMQAITLLAMEGRAQGLEPAYGIDGFLAGLAHGLGKTVLSLETPEQQLALLQHDDPADTERQVAEALDELEQGRAGEVLHRLAQDWAQGRLDDIARYAQWCDCLNSAEQRAFHRRLIDERNGPLARRVQQLHDAGHAVLVAVGALHMVGPQGLPALLAARGFRVVPVWPVAAPG